MDTIVKASSETEQRDPQRYLKLADQAAAKQDWEDAIANYQLVLRDRPQEADLYARLGQIYHHANQHGSAADCFYQALRLEPHRAKAMGYFHLGNTLLTQDKNDLAFVCYRRAIKREPHRAEFHYALGQVLSKQKMWNAAVAAYRQSLELEPNVSNVCHAIAVALAQTHQFGEARSFLQKAIELNPTEAKFHWELAKLWKIQGNLQEEVNCCLQALKSQPNYTEPYVHLRYNRLRYDISEDSDLLNDVISTCHQVIELKPDCTWVYSLLGYALTKKGQAEAAVPYYQIASCQKAMRRRPDIPPEVWKSAIRKAPDFLIIGGFKCATTSLYQYLNHHPQILPSLEKELDFFDLEYEQGLSWYQAQLPPIPQTSVFRAGEATPNYLYCPQAPQRVLDAFPDIKLIVILRDPIDRAVSHFHFVPQNGQKKRAIEEVFSTEMKRLEEAISSGSLSLRHLNQNRYLGHSLYLYPLQIWLSYFPMKNVKIVQQEALAFQPSAVLNSIFSFLELPAHELKEYQRHKLGCYSPISQELRSSLETFFHPHREKIEKLLLTC